MFIKRIFRTMENAVFDFLGYAVAYLLAPGMLVAAIILTAIILSAIGWIK